MATAQNRTESRQTSITQDNRVAATDRGVAIGNKARQAGANASESAVAVGARGTLNTSSQYYQIDDFSDNVAEAFRGLIGLAQHSVDQSNQSIASLSQSALEQVATRVDRQEQGDRTTITDFYPIVAIIVIAVAGIFILGGKKI